MRPDAAQKLIADVRLGDALDALYIVPRVPQEALDLLTSLKCYVAPGTKMRRSADGIRVPIIDEFIRPIPGIELKWSPDALRAVENRKRASEHYPMILKTLGELKSADGLALARQMISDSSGLSPLDSHQIVNVAGMTLPDGFGLCIFDEQGAGNTVTLIYAFDLLVARDQIDFAIIVAPKSMVPEWAADFVRFRGDLYRISIVSGSRTQKRKLLDHACDIFVTNFETTVSMESELKALLKTRPGRGILVVDESFFIKSGNAARTRSLRRLREWSGRSYVLCGTPAPNSSEDIVQQFNFVDFGLAFAGVEMPDEPAAVTVIIQDVIETRGLYIRHLKRDVLPLLPQKRFQRLYFPMQPVQAKLYKAALNNLVSDIEGATEEFFRMNLANFLARRSALLQICSNPIGVTKYSETPAKLIALDSLLSRLITQAREKVVVWSFYTASINAIVDRYEKYGALRYDGQVTSTEERRDVILKFQEDATSMLLVANPAAAGAGLTLHKSRTAIYESFSNQAAHYLQSLDRIHRRGQTREVEYIVLLCEGSIEYQEYARLIEKESSAQELLRDALAPSFTRDSFLADLSTAPPVAAG